MISKRKGLKFNMLLDWCIGKAAAPIKEFYLLPVSDELIQYDGIAANPICIWLCLNNNICCK